MTETLMMPRNMICARHGSHAHDIPGLNRVYLYIVVSLRFFSSPVAQRMAGRDDWTGTLADARNLERAAAEQAPLCCWMGDRWWSEIERIATEAVRPYPEVYAELDRIRLAWGEEVSDARP